RHAFLLNQRDDLDFYAEGKYVAKAFILVKSFLKLCVQVFLKKPTSVVFVQRECFMIGTSIFERLFSLRSKLVFDFDDSIWLPTISKGNHRLKFLKNPEKVKKIISFSSQVVCGNQYLADYAGAYNSKVVIIPSTIDTDKYYVRHKVSQETIIIGWSGSFTTVPHFEYLIPSLIKLQDKYGKRVAFLVIGLEGYAFQGLNMVSIPWNAITEVEDLHQMDIGIMPLPDNEWTRGKCGMKGLQYMAAGIPTVMSPIGVNKEIIQDGENGFLAFTEDEWVDKLSILIDSVDLRKKFGLNGRKTIEEKYSVKANAPRYLKLFNQVLNLN
ncbi:MAG: glycosyltransferase family 4 protein, partial [Cryomorphaceae bacterium]|nr:glycosyltransferase family 4 protein [Cryomorphaceae bacterium]